MSNFTFTAAADMSELNRTTTSDPCGLTAKSVASPTTYDFYRTIVDVYVVSALCVAGVIGNALSLVVLRKDRDRPNATNWLLQALAVVDTLYLVASAVIQPIKTVNDVGAPGGPRDALRRVFPYVEPQAWALASTAQTATVWLVLLVTVDRYVAVCQPLKHISLVSSFGASLMLGAYAPIDESDGSGMNLMDLKARIWSPACLQAHGADDLAEKLGKIVPSSQCVGFISKYLVHRYGFAADCRVIAFTGDNPASMAGIQAQSGDIVVSLGTSDTVLMWLEEPKVSVEGAVLVNPLDTNHYMGLLCFKNGSLTRERVRNTCCGESWQEFSEMLKSTPRGNNGNIGIYFHVPEITPDAVGVFRFDSSNNVVDSFSRETEVRAVIEGQFLARRMYAENLGYSLGRTGRVLATGGASRNEILLQVLSDVFNSPVYVQNVADSACLGSAYRAKHGCVGGKVSFQDAIKKSTSELTCAVTPNPDASQVYDAMLERYRTLERRITTC